MFYSAGVNIYWSSDHCQTLLNFKNVSITLKLFKSENCCCLSFHQRKYDLCRDFSETKQFPVFVKQLYLNIKIILAVNSFKQGSFYVWKKSACLQFSLEYIPLVWRGNTIIIHKVTNEVFLLCFSQQSTAMITFQYVARSRSCTSNVWAVKQLCARQQYRNKKCFW